MVNAGSALVHNANGKVKSIRLITAAAGFAHRIGEPTGNGLGGVRFTRRVRSDDHAFVWWEFHPRSTYEPD